VEVIRFVALYFLAMLKSMIIVTETPFVLALVYIVVGIKCRLQTPRGT
jgi:choline-glycine betaine transporter